MEGLGSRDGLAVEPGRPLRCQVAEEVALGSCLDLGVLAGDVGIAEDADLGAFVQAKAAALVSQQVDAALLASTLHLDPGPAQGLLDQGKEEAQSATQDHDPESLAQVVAIAQSDTQLFEAAAAHEAAQSAADQAEDQALARPVGQPLAQANAQAEDRPGTGPTEQTAAEEADHQLAEHQPEGTAEGGRRHAPRHRAGQLVPGTVAKRTPGGQKEPDRAADQQARQGVANVDRFRLYQFHIKVQPEK